MGKGLERHNAYRILGVEPAMNLTDIKKAYFQAARTLHPDKGGDTKRFQQLQQAYMQILEERNAKSTQPAEKEEEKKEGEKNNEKENKGDKKDSKKEEKDE